MKIYPELWPESMRYSRVEVVAPGGTLVGVKVPGVPRNHHVLLIKAEPHWDVQYACYVAGLRAKQFAENST